MRNSLILCTVLVGFATWITIADGEPTQKWRSRLFGTPEIERTYWKIKRATP